MVADYLPLLLRGAALSLCVMLSSLLVALLLGLINSLVKLFGPPWLRLFSTAYTTLVRGIPELVIMLLLFFGGEMLVNLLLGLVGLGIPGTANHIATPVSRFLALLGVLRQPGKTQEGMQALVRLLAPDTTVQVSPYCLRPVEIGQPLGFYGDDDFLLDGNTPLGEEAMDAGSQLLVALRTDNEQEAQGWKPDGLLYQDFLVMLRVYLGWRFKARITLTTRTRLLAVPPLGEEPFWLGMNGVLGAEEGAFADDLPLTFTTELGYYTGLAPAKPQQGNRRAKYKFD